MYKINEAEKRLELSFSSKFSFADRAVEDIVEFLKSYISTDFSDYKLALHEAINNAVEHGNRQNETTITTIAVTYGKNNSFTTSVKDEGDGFDYKSIDYDLKNDNNQPRSRGFPLINRIIDSIGFNESGNEIILRHQFVLDTTFKIIENSEDISIIPNGKITSACSEELKRILLDIDIPKYRKIAFDFGKVSELDSVGLSILIVFSKMVKDKNSACELAIESAEMNIMQLFIMTGMEKIFSIMP